VTPIDITTAEAQQGLLTTLPKGDPRRRAQREPAGGEVLRGPALRAEIAKLIARYPDQSNADIANVVGCSRAYVARCRTTSEPKGDRFPPEVFAKMLAALRSGAVERKPGNRGQTPAVDLLDIPGVAECFTVRNADQLDAEAIRALRRVNLRMLISNGGKATSGQARELYLARQEGLLASSVGAA
jgi:hypothetical protein